MFWNLQWSGWFIFIIYTIWELHFVKPMGARLDGCRQTAPTRIVWPTPSVRAGWRLHLHQHCHALGPQSQSGHIMNKVSRIHRIQRTNQWEMAWPASTSIVLPGAFLPIPSNGVFPVHTYKCLIPSSAGLAEDWQMGIPPAPACLQNLSTILGWNH